MDKVIRSRLNGKHKLYFAEMMTYSVVTLTIDGVQVQDSSHVCGLSAHQLQDGDVSQPCWGEQRETEKYCSVTVAAPVNMSRHQPLYKYA